MNLTLHTIKPSPRSKHKKKRVGRGDASGHGTYSTRGQKGQRSRSGGRSGLKLKGFRRMILSIPKLRGFKSPHPKPAILNLKDLSRILDKDVKTLGVPGTPSVDTKKIIKITPQMLLRSGLVRNIKNGVKILGEGEIKRPIILQGCMVSKSAKEKIEKAGGNIEADRRG